MKDSISRFIVAITISFAGCLAASAVPAKPGLLTMTQSDGSTVRVRLIGDERSHFYLSEDGYLLANDNDMFYYADVDREGNVVRSDIRVCDKAARTAEAERYLASVDMENVLAAMEIRANARVGARSPFRGPGLFPGTPFPSTGEQKAIVILVEYSDVEMSTSDPFDYFNRLLNEEGFSSYGGTGSARDFFVECSSGQFLPQFDLYGPVTLSKTRSYYGGNDYYGNDQHPEEMIIEACQALDASVDFSEYDRDGDGYIDNVFVFYAGRGEASGGGSDTVWPHSWNVTYATSTPYIFDGVRLDRYACSNEWEGSRPDGVGTFIHEFSHVMGLPDLYATSYTSAFTPGSWSTLDYGPYNNNGCTPPLYSAFERYALGWIEPLEIKEAVSATLLPISENMAGIIKTSKENEYFLVENRQQTGWDQYIPGHGMLVWHVDYNESVWNQNTVNNTASHQYVDIEEADGIKSETSRAGDAFPGTSMVTSFTDDTTPNMKTWSGQSLGLPITDIAENDGIITFKVLGGREPMGPTVALSPENITAESFVARWEAVDGANGYLLSVYTKSGSEVTYLPGYNHHQVGAVTEWEVTGCEPETEYFYTVYTGDGWEMSDPSNEVQAYTGRLPLSRRAVVALEASDVAETSFTAGWLPDDEASSYYLTVYMKNPVGSQSDICDFTDGVDRLPAGWVSSSATAYALAAYSGASKPSLRFGQSGDYIASPRYAEPVKGVNFWHRGNGTSDDDVLNVSVLADGNWTRVASVPVVTASGGYTATVDGFPAAAESVRIEYVRTGAKGAVAIDDIEVLWGTMFEPVLVAGYDDLDAGNVTEYAVGGLTPGTDYFYTVVASDGDSRSLPSNEIAVRTAGGNDGIVGVTDDMPVVVRAVGLELIVTGAPAGQTVEVSDVAGRIVAAGRASAEGECCLTVPSAGMYIMVMPGTGRCRKMLLK